MALAIDVGAFLFRAVGGLVYDLYNPGYSNCGGDAFFAVAALAAVPIAIRVWRRRRLAWIVFAPYEIVALVIFLGQTLNA